MKKVLLTTAILGISGCAFAAAPAPVSTNVLGWYVGAGVNYHAITTAKHRFPNLIDEDPVFGPHDVEMRFRMTNAQVGINLFAGNRLTQHFGTEAGFSYVGDIKYTGSKDLHHHDFYLNSDDRWECERPVIKSLNNYNLYYDAYFYYPLNPGSVHSFDVFARAGVGFMHSKDFLNKPASKAAYGTWEDASNTLSTFALNWGAGVQYNYREFGIRAYYSHFAPSVDAEDFFYMPDNVNLDVIWVLG